MEDVVYDRVKKFLTRWAFPMVMIIGGLGTFITSIGYDIAIYTSGAVGFLGIISQAFQVEYEHARLSYYANKERGNDNE